MKKKSVWLLSGIMIVAMLVFFGYCILDRINTDTKAPEILMDTEKITVSVKDQQELLLEGVTALDDVDGDVTGSLVVESVYGIDDDHCATVVYAAFDSSGNVAKAERTVQYKDYKSPRFTLSRALAFEAGSNFEVLDIVGATDVIEGNIHRRVKATMLSNGSSVKEEGNHQVQFQVTNSLGDTSQITLPIEVYPTDSFDANLELSEYIIYLPKGSVFEPKDYLLGFTYRMEEFDLSEEIPEMLTIETEGNVDVAVPGVYPVSYMVKYTVDENHSYVGYSKLIVVVEG